MNHPRRWKNILHKQLQLWRHHNRPYGGPVSLTRDRLGTQVHKNLIAPGWECSHCLPRPPPDLPRSSRP